MREGLSEKEKRQHVRRLNILRRHLTQEQKRELIRDQVRETPDRSNRHVARDLGVSHVTVGTVREDLESGGQIDHLDRVAGPDGKSYPRHQPIRRAPDPDINQDVQEDDSGICLDCGEHFEGDHICDLAEEADETPEQIADAEPAPTSITVPVAGRDAEPAASGPAWSGGAGRFCCARQACSPDWGVGHLQPGVFWLHGSISAAYADGSLEEPDKSSDVPHGLISIWSPIRKTSTKTPRSRNLGPDHPSARRRRILQERRSAPDDASTHDCSVGQSSRR